MGDHIFTKSLKEPVSIVLFFQNQFLQLPLSPDFPELPSQYKIEIESN